MDETFVGGPERNKHELQKIHQGRGGAGKSSVVRVNGRVTSNVRAEVIESLRQDTLHGFIGENVAPGLTMNTDDFRGCGNLD